MNWTLYRSNIQIFEQKTSPGLKLFEAQTGTAAEYDKVEAEKYKAEIEAKIATLENEAHGSWLKTWNMKINKEYNRKHKKGIFYLKKDWNAFELKSLY